MTDELTKTRSEEHGIGAETEAALAELERAADDLKIPPVGAIIGGRYRVNEQLGSGAFGWVFGVTHTQLGQSFALKILIPRIAQDPDWVARFREEAKATSLIGHENIVFVTDFGTDDDFGEYLVMEYLDGMNLRDLLARGPQPMDRVLRFVIEAGSALGAVHELGIVHCDLKPSNVFMIRQEGKNERWKLIDFGTSSFVVAAVDSDKVFGTPRYMAPEQAAGRPVDHRADQFALACIVYEMVTGQLPWVVNGWEDAMPANRAQNPVKPPSLMSSCSHELDEVLLRALSVKPHKRFESTERFVEAVQECIDVDVVPSPDPFDHVATGTFERSFSSPRVEVPDLSRTSSIQIGMPNRPFATLPLIRITYTNAARLRREYRRNLIAGRMFIPSDVVLHQGTKVEVQLEYEPNKTFVNLEGEVIDVKDVMGFGVQLDADSRDHLKKFLNALRLGFGFIQNDVLVRGTPPNPPKLNSSQAFVLSKLGVESRVGRLRAELNSLPIAFEETIASLIEMGMVRLHQAAAGDSSSLFIDDSIAELADESTVFDREMTASEVAQLLDTVTVFKEKQNYLAAISILQNAVEISSNVAAFRYELAVLLEEFVGDRQAAIAQLDAALDLDPANHTFRGYRTRLDE